MHRPVPSYLTLALSFSMRLKCILNIPAQQESGVCTCIALCIRDSLLLSVVAERGFPRWLIVQWVVRSEVLSLEYTTQFLPWFPPILQSEQVDASWGKSEPVCRLLLTDSTENHVVYYDHRLRFFSFSLWFYPVGGYQTCLIFQPILGHLLFSFVMRLLATRSTFLREFVVIGTTLKSGSVWSSGHVVYDAQFSFVIIYKVGKCMMSSVFKNLFRF